MGRGRGHSWKRLAFGSWRCDKCHSLWLAPKKPGASKLIGPDRVSCDEVIAAAVMSS